MEKASWKRKPGSAQVSGQMEGVSQALPEPRALRDFRTHCHHSSLSPLPPAILELFFLVLLSTTATFFFFFLEQQKPASLSHICPFWSCLLCLGPSSCTITSMEHWPLRSSPVLPAAFLQSPLPPVLFALCFIFTHHLILIDTNSSLHFPWQNKGFTEWIKIIPECMSMRDSERIKSKEQGKLQRGLIVKKVPPKSFSDFTKLVCLVKHTKGEEDMEIIQLGNNRRKTFIWEEKFSISLSQPGLWRTWRTESWIYIEGT